MRKVCAGEVGSCAAVFAAEKALVGFQNFHQRLSVMLDAFRFSESHALSAIEDVRLIVYSM
jgi:hypothetical protein